MIAPGWLTHEELERVADPSGQTDAVLVQSSTGGWDSFSYKVFVVAHGGFWRWRRPVATLSSAQKASGRAGADLAWTAADHLTIHYASARDARLEKAKLKVHGR